MNSSGLRAEACHESGIDPLTHGTWGRHNDEIIRLHEGKRPRRVESAQEMNQIHSWCLRGAGERPPSFMFAGAPTNAR